MKFLKALNKSFKKSFKKFDTRLGLLLLTCLGFILVVYYCLKKQKEAFNTDSNIVVYGGEETFDKEFDASAELPELLFNPDTHVALGYLYNNSGNWISKKRAGMIYKYNGNDDKYAGYYVCVFQETFLKLSYFTIENGKYTPKGVKYVKYDASNIRQTDASQTDAGDKQKAYDKATYIGQKQFKTVNTKHNRGLWPLNKNGIIEPNPNKYRLSFIKVFKKDYINQTNDSSDITKLKQTVDTPSFNDLQSMAKPQIIHETYTGVDEEDVDKINDSNKHIEWFKDKVPSSMNFENNINRFDKKNASRIINRYYGFIKLICNTNKSVKLNLESDDASYLYIIPYDDDNFSKIFNTETEIITTEEEVLNSFLKIDNGGAHPPTLKYTNYEFESNKKYLFIIYHTNSIDASLLNFYIGNDVNASLKNNNDLEIIQIQNILDKNKNYRGSVNKTITGNTCQAWNSDKIHNRSDRVKNAYNNRMDGIGDHNYCRNPDDGETIWCYTTDPDTRWEYCDINPTPTPTPTPAPTPAAAAPTPAAAAAPAQPSTCNNESKRIQDLEAQLNEVKILLQDGGFNYIK